MYLAGPSGRIASNFIDLDGSADRKKLWNYCIRFQKLAINDTCTRHSFNSARATIENQFTCCCPATSFSLAFVTRPGRVIICISDVYLFECASIKSRTGNIPVDTHTSVITPMITQFGVATAMARYLKTGKKTMDHEASKNEKVVVSSPPTLISPANRPWPREFTLPPFIKNTKNA